MARFPRSRLATLFFSKNSMCSYEKAGWSASRYLGFCDHRAGNFSHMNTPAQIQKPGLSGTKHFQLCMACKVAGKSQRGSTGILVAFWTFVISITGIKFPIYMNRRQNSSHQRGQPGYRAHMKRPQVKIYPKYCVVKKSLLFE